jgi:uncharacterized protein
VNFAWQGGEPTLLGVRFFQKVVELQKKYANGKKIENAFQTNGILINDTWCEFFSENDFLIGLSVDGPKELHDFYRVNKSGKPTFDRVIKALQLMKRHDVKFNALTVINKKNAQKPLEVYHFLKENGSGFIQFIPIVERIAETVRPEDLSLVLPDFRGKAMVAEWSANPEDFGAFLITIFDEWVRNDVGTQFIQLFDVALESWLGLHQSLCLFNETCGHAMAIEHNGDLYSCDHFVYPENRLGNIMSQPLRSLVTSQQQVIFGTDKKNTLPDYCRKCEVVFACNGECPKNRFITTPEGDYGLNYLCLGYKMFFKHIDPYMRFMSQELQNHRPPANVMIWSHEKDKGFPSLKIGRNDPCPCGSGEKFKKCCWK